jgi:hypothetical protein
MRRRHRVQLERVRVVDPDALAAGLAGTDPAGPGVEQREQAVFLARGEDRPERRVIGGERLQRGVKLDSAQAQRGDVRDLGDRRVALVRIDRADAGKRVGVIAAGGRHRLVRHSGTAGGGLGIPGQQHGLRVERAVLVRELAERLPRHRRAEVRLGRLDVARHAAVQPVRRRQVHMKINGPH